MNALWMPKNRKNIRSLMNTNFKIMFMPLWYYYDVEINTRLGGSVYGGKAVTVGRPYYELVVDPDNMRYPFKPKLRRE